MTIGIYAMSFNNYDSVYIGQSVNISLRISKHLSLLKHNKHYNYKLQNLYNIFGVPETVVIEECALSELNFKENQWIQEFDSFNNGLNLRTIELTSNKGYEHSQAKFSEQQIIDTFELLLDSSNLIRHISECTGVSEGMVSMISNGQNHRWLEERFPDKYTILISLIGSRRKYGQSAFGKQRLYPPIKDRGGNVYTNIANLKEFAKLHNLNYTHLCQLLNKRKGHNSVNGWTLV
jgi:hypothetical protein